MKLFFAHASPFARKVMATAHEAGLADKIELMVLTGVTPIERNSDIGGQNPLAKIPTLVLDNGEALYDSRVICEYLDDLNKGAKLFPPAGPQRFRALRHQALGDGIMDAAVGIRYETFLRPEDKRWPQWVDGQMIKIGAALDGFAAALGSEPAPDVTIGDIAAACALGYLDFRQPDHDWRTSRPSLTSWYEEFSARPSMRATVPE